MGAIEIEGVGTLKDAKLFPGGAREWDWVETGTRHSPGIQPTDVLELLHAKGITAHVLETREAVRLYNELAATEAVGALLHSTC